MYEWTNGEVITADKLNNTGNIVMLPTTPDGLDVSFNDIASFLQQGVLPVIVELNADDHGVMMVCYLYAAIPHNGEYYARFSGLVAGELEVVSFKANSPSEKMVWA